MRIFFRIKKNRIHARVLPSSSFQLKLVAAWSTTVLPRVGNLFDSRADRKFKVGGDERTYRIYDTAGIYEAVAECVRFNFPLLRGTN